MYDILSNINIRSVIKKWRWVMSAIKKNRVRELRESQLMSKAELARKAGISALTIDRVEKGKDCRMDTKRKIILALGFKLAEKEKVFPES